MIQVLPKIVVWAILIAIAYFAFGPNSIDTSANRNPLNESSAKLFLPPVKPERLVNYEQRLSEGQLEPGEIEDYQALSREHQSRFWKGSDTSVDEALNGVKNNRGERLASILSERGLSKEEQVIFFTVLRRDHPVLLEDVE